MLVKWFFRITRDYLMPIAFGGLIGGLLVGAFLIWPKVYGAEWWEVFTAFGTVGSAGLALLFGLRRELSQAKTKRLRGQISLGEVQTRARAAEQSVILLKGAYLMISPRYSSYEIEKTLDRIEAHLQNIVELFDDDFLEKFGEIQESRAASLITQLGNIKLLRVEFGIFSFYCRRNIEKAKNLARENRQKAGQFKKALESIGGYSS